jgi:hypothetical protein
MYRMMDQLASIGVAFEEEAIDKMWLKNAQYYEHPPKTNNGLSRIFSRKEEQWAVAPVYNKHKPIRPFGLGQL